MDRLSEAPNSLLRLDIPGGLLKSKSRIPVEESLVQTCTIQFQLRHKPFLDHGFEQRQALTRGKYTPTHLETTESVDIGLIMQFIFKCRVKKQYVTGGKRPELNWPYGLIRQSLIIVH